MDSAVDLIGEIRISEILIRPVILSGGTEAQSWPQSREALPGSPLPLPSDRSLLQLEALQTMTDPAFAEPIIVCGAHRAGAVADEMIAAGIAPRTVIVQPVDRDTAPALAAAALIVIATDPDAMLLVQPPDRRIADPTALHAAIKRGLEAAAQGFLVAFGIESESAEAGQGYVRPAAALLSDGLKDVHAVRPKGSEHDGMARGKYLSRSDFFLFSAKQYLSELEKFEPEVFSRCAEAVARATRDNGTVVLDQRHFAQSPSISIHRAIMERSTSAAVVSLPLSGEDIEPRSPRDAAGTGEQVDAATVRRPWGSFTTVDGGPRHQVKQIVVDPGQKLSLQLHHHRSEHWVVVAGTAQVTCGDANLLLQENQSVYIPAGSKHRLENPGKIPLRVIEVQCGPYLGEDDIVRVEDTYGRV